MTSPPKTDTAQTEQRVLVVEDDPAIRTMMQMVFTRHHFGVAAVGTGEEALVALETWAPGVIFLDLNLPGMNGVTLCRRIRSVHPDAKVYAVTGYANASDIEEIAAAGFAGHFIKPVPLKTLIDVAHQAFGNTPIQ